MNNLNLTLQLSQEVSKNILTFNVKTTTKKKQLAFSLKNDKYFEVAGPYIAKEIMAGDKSAKLSRDPASVSR